MEKCRFGLVINCNEALACMTITSPTSPFLVFSLFSHDKDRSANMWFLMPCQFLAIGIYQFDIIRIKIFIFPRHTCCCLIQKNNKNYGGSSKLIILQGG